MNTASILRGASNLFVLTAVLGLVLVAGTASASEGSAFRQNALKDALWSPTHFPVLVTQTKFAAEDLLYDFGNQQFVSSGARTKGAPLTLRLANIDVPNGIDGVDSELLFTRFFWFTRGNSDVKIGRNPKGSDVDVTMRILPTTVSGQRTYSLRMEARATHGKAKGKLLYVKTRPIQ